jgi:hypothetical protein
LIFGALSQTPVPDPATVSPIVMRQLLSLVDERMTASVKTELDIERQLDDLIIELYGLSVKECQALGIKD